MDKAKNESCQLLGVLQTLCAEAWKSGGQTDNNFASRPAAVDNTQLVHAPSTGLSQPVLGLSASRAKTHPGRSTHGYQKDRSLESALLAVLLWIFPGLWRFIMGNLFVPGAPLWRPPVRRSPAVGRFAAAVAAARPTPRPASASRPSRCLATASRTVARLAAKVHRPDARQPDLCRAHRGQLRPDPVQFLCRLTGTTFAPNSKAGCTNFRHWRRAHHLHRCGRRSQPAEHRHSDGHLCLDGVLCGL